VVDDIITWFENATMVANSGFALHKVKEGRFGNTIWYRERVVDAIMDDESSRYQQVTSAIYGDPSLLKEGVDLATMQGMLESGNGGPSEKTIAKMDKTIGRGRT